MAAAGWYPDESLPDRPLRYWDGAQWTDRLYTPPPTVTVVQGPNHVLHGLLTLFTWPLCGGWGWVWLVIAADNRKRVYSVPIEQR